MRLHLIALPLACLVLAPGAGAGAAPAAAPASAAEPPVWRVPVAGHRLANGLRVVVSEDATTPTFGLAVVYDVGFRSEPQGSSGFAHLFEHMMFQGTPRVAKGVFGRVVLSSGGIYGASTRSDYTHYRAALPVAALERLLWLEADRMRALDLSAETLENQRQVVKEEIRRNVHNRPFGAFTWIDLPALAFDRWANAHDGYGSFEDLDAAGVSDVRAFHRTYYAPNNAVIAIAGDVEPARAFALVEKHFGDLPAQPLPARPELAEPLGRGERWQQQEDDFARVAGLAVGWRAPPPGSEGFYALALLGELLAGGDASRLHRELVRGRGLLEEVWGGLGYPLGDPLSVRDPALLTLTTRHRPEVDGRSVVAAIDAAVAELVAGGPAKGELERVRSRLLSTYYAELEPLVDRARLLALGELLHGDAAIVNRYPERLLAVGAEDLRRAAAEYLTAENRSVVERRPRAGGEGDRETAR